MTRAPGTARRTTADRRRGTLLVAVLVSISLLMMLFTVWLRTVGQERRQVREQQCRIQAEYLADAAIGRAISQLAIAPDYQGESWRLPAESLGGRGSATVEIVVSPVADQPRSRSIRAVADFPSEGIDRARRSKVIRMVLKKPGDLP
jgi:hypothetical protein